jgi:cobalt-precorrin 5A hydrolase
MSAPVDLAIGLGCRKGASGEAIVSLVRAALESAARQGAAALFTVDAKMGETGLDEAAAALGMPLHFLSADALKAVAGQAQTHSPRVEAMFGLPTVAETAALAGAGPGAVLILPRISADGVTCAIARASGGRAA